MRVAIFDLDGTLVDTAPDIVDAVNRTLADGGLPGIGLDAGRAMIGGGARDLLAQALAAVRGEAADDREVDDALARFLIHYGEGSTAKSTIYPGVCETLERLAADGVAMGVCTNKPHAISLVVLAGLDLMHYFRAVVGGDALAERKPAGGHLLETVRRTEKAATQVIMVGDSATDVAAARNARVPVVAVSYGYTRVPAADLGADALIHDMRDLPGAMETLWVTA